MTVTKDFKFLDSDINSTYMNGVDVMPKLKNAADRKRGGLNPQRSNVDLTFDKLEENLEQQLANDPYGQRTETEVTRRNSQPQLR